MENAANDILETATGFGTGLRAALARRRRERRTGNAGERGYGRVEEQPGEVLSPELVLVSGEPAPAAAQ